MVIKFSEASLQLSEVWKYLTDAESKGTDIDIAELKKWLLASHEKMMSHGRKRTDFRKTVNDTLISNMEKDCTTDRVKAKVEMALSKVTKDGILPPKTVVSVKKLPRNLGKSADLFKVTLGTDKIVDKQGRTCFPQQKIIAGISAFNQANKNQKLYASAFIPTCVKEQGNRLNDLARKIREKNRTNKWFTRLIVSQKEMRLILKVKSPNRDSKWCELSDSKLPAAFHDEYKEILDIPDTPYIPAKARGPPGSAPPAENDAQTGSTDATHGSQQAASQVAPPPVGNVEVNSATPPQQQPSGEQGGNPNPYGFN